MSYTGGVKHPSFFMTTKLDPEDQVLDPLYKQIEEKKKRAELKKRDDKLNYDCYSK